MHRVPQAGRRTRRRRRYAARPAALCAHRGPEAMRTAWGESQVASGRYPRALVCRVGRTIRCGGFAAARPSRAGLESGTAKELRLARGHACGERARRSARHDSPPRRCGRGRAGCSRAGRSLVGGVRWVRGDLELSPAGVLPTDEDENFQRGLRDSGISLLPGTCRRRRTENKPRRRLLCGIFPSTAEWGAIYSTCASSFMICGAARHINCVVEPSKRQCGGSTSRLRCTLDMEAGSGQFIVRFKSTRATTTMAHLMPRTRTLCDSASCAPQHVSGASTRVRRRGGAGRHPRSAGGHRLGTCSESRTQMHSAQSPRPSASGCGRGCTGTRTGAGARDRTVDDRGRAKRRRPAK